ncbi:hypothetical protein E2562_007498 [Oryza meyeriana var. granulata]|uniref:Phosphatidic acid phosphatase type 2/haloperoxidase domain-containing protein n=1 Tax=Oryza meyeriana var. granulata TaxID=110450 RepID=A0A6G1DVA5_9ORYZ|nr:hypothetical protein E2562_007498 [Oryza meyeriana var. granulata]
MRVLPWPWLGVARSALSRHDAVDVTVGVAVGVLLWRGQAQWQRCKGVVCATIGRHDAVRCSRPRLALLDYMWCRSSALRGGKTGASESRATASSCTAWRDIAGLNGHYFLAVFA